MTHNDITEAEALRAQAARNEQAAADSFERCDTDGFVSQWALGVTAQQHRLQADIVENGGKGEFLALFDLDGNLVPAKLVETRYGVKFAVFATVADVKAYGAPVVAWVDPFVKAKTLARKGYRKGHVLAAAKAELKGSGKGLAGAMSVRPVMVRTDGGFDPDAEVVDIEEAQ